MNQAGIIVTCGVLASAAMLGLGVAIGSSGGASLAMPAGSGAGTPDRAAVETIIRDYLITNPEVMLEVQAAFEAKQQEQQRGAQQELVRAHAGEIFDSAADGVIGNPDAKTTIVEFFDYNCGYCRGALADMRALVEGNPDLRFVLKEFPILGADSQKAHIVSMAFQSLYPEKYGEFHQGLLGSSGRADEASAMELALSLGGDEAALREAMGNPAVTEAIGRNYALASALSITVTPAYIVGEEILFGAIGQDALKEKLASLAN